jgi:hypothetical protein
MSERDPYGGRTPREYLEGLALDFGLPREPAFLTADLLGPNEDFDGLITQLEDLAEDEDWQDWQAPEPTAAADRLPLLMTKPRG